MIKTLFILAAGALLCGCASVAPKTGAPPKDAGVAMALTNYFTVMNQLVVEVPQATNVAGAVTAIDTWTSANNVVVEAGEALVREHPDYATNPPPWLVEYFARATAPNTNYTSVALGMGTLIKDFHKDPAMAAAVSRYQRSLNRMDVLTKLGQKDMD
jgi:uncharacterized protein YceK